MVPVLGFIDAKMIPLVYRFDAFSHADTSPSRRMLLAGVEVLNGRWAIWQWTPLLVSEGEGKYGPGERPPTLPNQMRCHMMFKWCDFGAKKEPL